MKPELIRTVQKPSLDAWLAEAQTEETAKYCGMYLFHTGVVRAVPRALARTENPPVPSASARTGSGAASDTPGSRCRGQKDDAADMRCDRVPGSSALTVTGMKFSYDAEKAEAAIARAEQLPGIFHVRVWLNEGLLSVGDPLMQVLIGGDIRPRVIAALESLVEELKTACVSEKEL